MKFEKLTKEEKELIEREMLEREKKEIERRWGSNKNKYYYQKSLRELKTKGSAFRFIFILFLLLMPFCFFISLICLRVGLIFHFFNFMFLGFMGGILSLLVLIWLIGKNIIMAIKFESEKND